MVNKRRIAVAVTVLAVLCPVFAEAQQAVTSDQAAGLQGTLNTVMHTMQAKCGELTGVARGIAGFAALWYIAYRIWGHLTRAESIDFFPLLRPFAIGFALLYYPALISLMNTVLEPTVDGTAKLVDNSNTAIASLLAQKEALLEQGQEWQMYVGPDGSGSMDKWAQYTGNTDNNGISTAFGLTNWVKFEMSKAAYNLKNSFKVWLSQLLEILYEAAALCVNTVRIFYLVVLAIVGPLCFALSVFNGLHHVLNAWFARYIHIFLWLPVCNIFASIIGQVQVEMLKIDIKQLQDTGSTSFGATDAAYMIFLVMGVVGYLTVPSITQHIITIFPSGGGAHMVKVTNTVNNVASGATDTALTAAKGGMTLPFM
jgi:conjugative transposon TraJ protein